MLGASSIVIVTSSKLSVQTPFDTVQRKVFTPADKPVTPELKSPGTVTVPPPATTVQTPVPTNGLLPAKVAVPGSSHTV